VTHNNIHFEIKDSKGEEMKFKYLSRVLVSIILLLIMTTPSFAHRVNVFAYVEGDTVFTESYFSKKRKVHQGKIEILNAETGKVLLTGVTDDDGLFNFPIPEAIKKDRNGLLINLQASEGHRGDWTLTADEIFPESPVKEKTAITSSPAKSSDPVPMTSSVETTKATSSEIAQLTTQVKNLTNKVETLKRLIISQQEKGPGVNEIFSGIGYILGLFGVAAFFLSRKK
jgi:nickel transport protein